MKYSVFNVFSIQVFIGQPDPHPYRFCQANFLFKLNYCSKIMGGWGRVLLFFGIYMASVSVYRFLATDFFVFMVQLGGSPSNFAFFC